MPPPSSAVAAAENSAPLAGVTEVAEKKAIASGKTKAAGKRAEAQEPAKVASNEPSQGGGFGGIQFSSGGQPINVHAESLSFDDKGKSATWTGHVQANQGNTQLSSNTLRLNYGNDFHDVREVIAIGNVRISQGTRWATGDHAVLDNTKHTVVLTGSPVLHDGEDQITGTKVTVHLDTNQSDVENASAVIFPHEAKPPADGATPGGGADSAHAAPESGAGASEQSPQGPPRIEGAPNENNP
ncbi:MAG: LptA/OstA family protein [Candidatus Binataceae bacterium]